jgi:hypothetical protein
LIINPYKPTSQLDVQVDWKDVVGFNGVVNEEHFRKLIPKRQLRLFAVLGSLLLGVGGSMLLASFVVAAFLIRDPFSAVLSFVVLTLLVVASCYCFRCSSSAIRARAILKKFPDLLGPMSGSFSESGLMLSDGQKTHWFPWVLLSQMMFSKHGVHIALGTDPTSIPGSIRRVFRTKLPSMLETIEGSF